MLQVSKYRNYIFAGLVVTSLLFLLTWDDCIVEGTLPSEIVDTADTPCGYLEEFDLGIAATKLSYCMKEREVAGTISDLMADIPEAKDYNFTGTVVVTQDRINCGHMGARNVTGCTIWLDGRLYFIITHQEFLDNELQVLRHEFAHGILIYQGRLNGDPEHTLKDYWQIVQRRERIHY